MQNSFPFSDDNKRYHTWNYHLRHLFGQKICKVSLNGGFTCPNIDGSKGVGGCTYCFAGSSSFEEDSCASIACQFKAVKSQMLQKWHDVKYIAYFQSHTNTYAPLPVLKEKFEEALRIEDVVGLSIAIRADCLPEDICDYLMELSKRTYLIVELGLQTIHDQTGKFIHRGHDYAEFLAGYEKLHQRGIAVCVHIINGLPHETPSMMLETVEALAQLDLHSLKIHMLHVMKGTAMAEQYINGDFSIISMEEYVQIVCDQLERLPAQVIIQRITGDAPRSVLIAPEWSMKKKVVMNEIDKEMARRNCFQGCRFVKGMDA